MMPTKIAPFALSLILATSLVFAQDSTVLDKPTVVANFLASFKTFNHQPLVKLLKNHNLKIAYVAIYKLSSLGPVIRPSQRASDLLVSIDITGLPESKMACHFRDYMKPGDDLAEITKRGDQFLTDDPELEPILFWAATGKCTDKFAYPSTP